MVLLLRGLAGNSNTTLVKVKCSSVFIENKPITRIGDTTNCNNCGQSGSHSTGSNNVFAGG